MSGRWSQSDPVAGEKNLILINCRSLITWFLSERDVKGRPVTSAVEYYGGGAVSCPPSSHTFRGLTAI